MVRIGMFLGDRYEILEKIGSGGMAQVFKGKDHKLNRFVAVKVLKDEFVEDKNFVRKFKEEAQAAAALAHPNIVNVYDVGDEQNINYIVMELVEGITLKTYIEKKGRLTVKEATSIAIQVASGLEIAHNNQIVHRDIKPQNIIISREGKVKVTDFGIAKSVSSNTNTADAMGSVHYTSPEQARGGYSDAKSDIYSLGIVMYEMVTGRVPFDGETTVVVAVKHLQEDIVSPRVYASDIPVSLEHIILKCTEKSPDRRYPNVTELIADLKQSLLTPDVNFVKEIVPDGAKTVAITRDEISKIKKETGRLPVDEDDAESRYAYLDRMNDDDEYDDDEYDDEYDDDDEYDEYDDDEYDDEYDDEEESDDEEDDDDEGGVLDPKLEKIMMIGGIAAAVIILIIVIVIVVRLVGFGGGSNNSSSDNEPEIEDVIEENPVVPDLLGMSYSEAQEALNELGLGIKVSETRSSDEYEAGQIIEQSVDKGTEVEPNTTIYVVICGDGSSVEVPDLEDYTRESAVSALENLGLSADVTEEYNDDVASGRVISTSPKAGESVERGGVVKIVISKGSEEDAQVQVPDLRNRSEATAKQLLSQAELSSGTVTTEASDTVASGNVISQSPSAGTTVEKGTSVSYVVSTGPDTVYIGNAMKNGSSESAVTAYLTGRGLKVSRSEEYSDTVAKGDVISYNPGNGSTVEYGSTVNIVVSLGREPVTTASVPDLTGRTADQARSALGSNFSLGEVQNGDEAPDYTKNGLIYWQSHSGTQQIGTTISVRIYSNIRSCTDKGKEHTAPSGTGEGVSTTCTVCGRTFTTPTTSTPTTPSDGTGSTSGGNAAT
ncbi:MAG TPA: Stk1 family PASTA domain-containing Ser/Thr kinase [Candidatus Merdisoma merdipullorum]|nr:Stk1 family PASTA domain-containing Ser/Thr kinase [Candidatus Merdisoma merdipullorum]